MKTIKKGGFTLRIERDEFCQSINEHPDIVFLISNFPRYLEVEQEEYPFEDVRDAFKEGKKFNNHYIFPVYVYAHSGVSLSLNNSYPFNCRYDSAQAAYILVPADQITEENAFPAAQECLKEWNCYLSGEIYCFTITDPSGDIVDSCAGFYGFEDCVDFGTSELNAWYLKSLKTRSQHLKNLIRSKVGINYRQFSLNRLPL